MTKQEQMPPEFQVKVQTLWWELDWLGKCIKQKLAAYSRSLHRESQNSSPFPMPTAPDLSGLSGPYADLVRELKLAPTERLLLISGLATSIDVGFWESEFGLDLRTKKPSRDWGLRSSSDGIALLPSGLTWLFLVAGKDKMKRFEAGEWFMGGHPLYDHGIVELAEPALGSNIMSGEILVNPAWVFHLAYGKEKPALAS